MAETSWFWSDSTGDGGPYDRNSMDDVVQLLAGGIDLTTYGVIADYESELAVSNPSGKTVRVASGGAIVDGKPYRNTANVDLTPTTPVVGTTGFRVVLRKSWAAQTVRAAIVMNTDGNSAAPAVTQNDGSTWEISLATGTITTGDVVSLTDDRSIVSLNGGGGLTPVAVGELAIGFGSVALSNAVGIDSASDIGTGVYQVVFDQQVNHVFFTIRLNTANDYTLVMTTNLPATTVTFTTLAAGTATDLPGNASAVHVLAFA